MARTFYQLLEASTDASSHTLKLLYEQKLDRLASRVAQGDEAARSELWALKEAYATLSDPVARDLYDQKLRYPYGPPPARLGPAEATRRPRRGLGTLTRLLLLAGALAALGAGLYVYHQRDLERQAQEAERIRQQAEAARIRAATQQARADEQRRAVERAAAERARMMEDRTAEQLRDAQSRRAESQAREDAAAAQRLAAEARVKAQQEQRSQRDAERAANAERAYWTCMNDALTRTSALQAEARCAYLRARR